MSMADRLDHEKTPAESHYCCDRNNRYVRVE
jgi:hypothetical protein